MTPQGGISIPGSSHWIAWYPDHEPRETEPHFKIFRVARQLLLSEGKGCWRCGSHDHLEAHHALVEYAQLMGIDIALISKDFPEIHDKESLMTWASGPENLEILCRDCHRGAHGIHTMPYPLWQAERWALENVDFLLPDKQK